MLLSLLCIISFCFATDNPCEFGNPCIRNVYDAENQECLDRPYPDWTSCTTSCITDGICFQGRCNRRSCGPASIPKYLETKYAIVKQSSQFVGYMVPTDEDVYFDLEWWVDERMYVTEIIVDQQYSKCFEGTLQRKKDGTYWFVVVPVTPCEPPAVIMNDKTAVDLLVFLFLFMSYVFSMLVFNHFKPF